jgi:hypothetical protein
MDGRIPSFSKNGCGIDFIQEFVRRFWEVLFGMFIWVPAERIVIKPLKKRAKRQNGLITVTQTV